MPSNVVEITVRANDETKKGFNSATQAAGGFKKSLTDVGKIASGVLTADIASAAATSMVNFAKDSVRAASDLNESINAVQKVFGDSAVVIEDWGKRNSTSIGLSTREFNQFATTLGASLKNAGLSMQDTTKWTIELQQRAADMASVFNTDVGTALEAIQAGLRGESDPLEQFGVSLTEAQVQAEALAETGKKTATSLTAQEKTTARLNLIMKQTKDTQGDFKDTSDGLANAQRRLSAETENAKAALGEKFLPVLEQLTNAAATAVGWVDDLSGVFEHLPGGPSPFFERTEEIQKLDEKLANLVSHGAAKSAAEQIVELSKKAEEAGYTVEEFSALFPKYGQALADAARGTKDATQASADHAKALQNEYDKSVQLSDQLLTERDAQRNLEEAIDNATESLKENGRNTDINTEAGRNNQAALDEIARSAAEARDAILKNGGSMDDASAAMARGRVAFEQTAVKMGIAKDKAKDLADKLFAIPPSVTTTAVVNTSAANARITELRNRLWALQGLAMDMHAGEQGHGAYVYKASGGIVGAAATGGVRSNSVMVGEHGPEIVDLPPGSRVHSNPDTERMMDKGSPGVMKLQLEWVGGNADSEFMAWLTKNIRIRGGVERAFS